jgi:Asp-tRNA(Asn)/Glu-tRNA(Gln) amidotransferase A subunit family amidase
MGTATGSDPALLSATELVALYRKKALSPVEATKATLARIERHNAAVNAYCHLDADGALAAALSAEARWAKGEPKGPSTAPLGVKDNVPVVGMPSRAGSRLTSNDPQAIDAPAVARMREQGAVILGKTCLPEYGWKATSDSPLTGLTRNPWDTRMTTGGSSAGAVAASVLGMGALQLGTDGGGSIRIPAGFTGCFGHKATRARVPAFPTSPLGTLAHIGPLTRTVADAALVMSIISAPDARDPYARITPAPDSPAASTAASAACASPIRRGSATPSASIPRWSTLSPRRRGHSRASAQSSSRPIPTWAGTPSAPGTRCGGRRCSISCRPSATAGASWPILRCGRHSPRAAQ